MYLQIKPNYEWLNHNPETLTLILVDYLVILLLNAASLDECKQYFGQTKEVEENRKCFSKI